VYISIVVIHCTKTANTLVFFSVQKTLQDLPQYFHLKNTDGIISLPQGRRLATKQWLLWQNV